jgi:hypothetical protein
MNDSMFDQDLFKSYELRSTLGPPEGLQKTTLAVQVSVHPRVEILHLIFRAMYASKR